jgi:hypothetical protein
MIIAATDHEITIKRTCAELGEARTSSSMVAIEKHRTELVDDIPPPYSDWTIDIE